jgi:integrase
MPTSGTGRLYQRGETWWVDYGFRGQRHRESTGSTKKADAVKLLRKRMAEMAAGKVMRNEEKVTLAEILELVVADYIAQDRRSLRRLKLAIRHVQDFFGPARALDVTTTRMNRYVDSRLAEGAARATVQQELAALKRAFRLAVKYGELSRMPSVPSLEANNTREGYFTDADMARLLPALPEYLRPVAEFAFLTGWRKGELVGLTWANVDFAAGAVRLAPGTTKNGKARTFPFDALPPLQALLHAQREHTSVLEREQGRIIPHVFHRAGRPVGDFKRAWASALKRARLEGMLFHDFRRSAVMNLEAAGVARSVAMTLTGHLTESVYTRYAIVDNAAQHEGVAKLARLHSTRAAPTLRITG